MAEPTDTETRGPINLRIKFRSASLEQFIERYSVDVSRGGIFIRTREPLAVGTRLRFDFQLLETGPLLQGEGTVVWIREYDPGRATVTPGMGVRFDKLSPESQQTLDKILAEKERLNQGGTAPGVITKSGAGIAVRRPSGTNPALDLPVSGGGSPAGGLGGPAGGGASPSPFSASAPITSSEARPLAPAPTPLASGPTAAPASPRSTGIFGRARTTTGGLSALRSGPVPSALFEPPTAADIDKALQVLEDKPGPVPAMPPPPRFSPGGGESGPSAVGPVRDDPSNEPTRVVDTPQEFSPHEAPTGRADVLPETGQPGAGTGTPERPIAGSEDLTARSQLDGGPAIPPLGAPPAAPAADLDAPLGAHLEEAPLGGDTRRVGAIDPAPMESGRFRADAKYRRSRPGAGKIVAAVVVLGGAAAALYYVKLRPQATAPIAAAPAGEGTPAAEAPGVAAEVPTPPAPEPPAAAAPDGAKVPGTEEAAPGGPPKKTGPSPGREADGKEAQVKAEGSSPKPAQSKRETRASKDEGEPEARPPSGDGERPSSSRRSRRERAASTEASGGAEAVAAGTETQPGSGPAGETGGGAAAGAGDSPAAAEAPPVLKITSSPSGAEVVIDGAAVGTTPFQSKEIDPTAPHAITVRKEGFEPYERMISGSDWTRGRGGAQSLKMSAKLRKTAAEGTAEKKDESSADKASEVEVLTPD